MNSVFNVEELFNGRLFQIPDYQRGYAWDEPQWKEFLEDLEILPDQKDHFTGTLVLHEIVSAARPTDDTGRQYAYVHVVDGQQRLTTIVLLLDALRREMVAFANLSTLASGIASNFLHVKDLNGERIYKIMLNRDCQPYFVNNILSDPPGPEGPLIASHDRLRRAKRYFRDYLAKFRAIAPADPSRLLRLYDKVAHRLRLNLYTVTEASDVGVIFEVMNNRGKQLSELEKVKNYLLYVGSKLQLPSPQNTLSDQVNNTWTNVFERLMGADLSASADEDQLLRVQWLMAYDWRSRNFEGSKSIKARFRLSDYHGKDCELLAMLLAYTKGLDQASVAYCDILNPGPNAFGPFRTEPLLHAKILAASEKLERINVVATFLPFLIAVRIRYPEDGQKYLEAVRICEIFAFRVYRLLDRRSDAGQKTIYRVASEVFGGTISFEEALRQLRAELLGFCPNHAFADRFKLNDEENNWYFSGATKYLLYEYEESLAKGHAVQLPWKVVSRVDSKSIEHILPQTPTHEYWKSRFDSSAHRCLVHDLGNLCLTSDNSVYGNKAFPDKRGTSGKSNCYADSNLFQERELSGVQDWNAQAIRDRRERIVTWALERWKVDDTDVGDAQIEDESQ